MLWQIPFSDQAFADQVPVVVQNDDVGTLYKLYENYIEHVKAQSRRR
jgi:hypothetical protein